jgi:hypothetical protein
MAGQHEDAGTDDAADAERYQAPDRERALQRHPAMGDQGLHLGLLGFGLQRLDRFSGEDVSHGRPP